MSFRILIGGKILQNRLNGLDFGLRRCGAPRHLLLLAAGALTTASTQALAELMLGLAYQPYVGQWSAEGDNPYAPGRLYTPSFDTYAGGTDPAHPARSLFAARQEIDLTLDAAGHLTGVQARGELAFQPEALRGADAARWSRGYFRRFIGRTAQPAEVVDQQASVYRQLKYLTAAASGAPVTLATYGTGFQAGYWRTLEGRGYATLPVWAQSQIRFIPAQGTPPEPDRSIDRVLFYFPPTAAYVRPAPELIRVETRGEPGRDLALIAVRQRLFAPARKGEPGARLNPGCFAGDANAQIALAAAEINAQAGQRLLTIKLGVDNLEAEGSLANDRMRFGILSALAQASVANARYPGTVTHLIVSNERARPVPPTAGHPTPTQQITAMVRFAQSQMAAGADFAGLGLAVGVRGNAFLAVDPDAAAPEAQQFTRDVAELTRIADFLMENRYPSPEAVEAARRSGRWDRYFDPDEGELTRQWVQLTRAIRALPGGERIELMIGEIGHPTRGIAFNLPGYAEGTTTAPAGSAFAEVAGALSADAEQIQPRGLETLSGYFNDTLATAFVTEAIAWSRRTGVQIHLFEAFDEPQKAIQNTPLPGLTLAQSTLSRSGPFGAEGAYGLFGYTGVAAFHAQPASGAPPRPGSKLLEELPEGARWAGQFSGSLHFKLPELNFSAAAHAFEAVISP